MSARLIAAKEMYAAPEPTDLMAWSICHYLLRDYPDGVCNRCPQWEEDLDYGKMKRGCRLRAEEVCRTVLAAKAKGDATDTPRAARPT